MIYDKELDRIKYIMGIITESNDENKQDKIKGLIQKYGILIASKFVGGMDVIEDIFGSELLKKMKIDAIMNYLERNDNWVNLNQYGFHINYRDEGNEPGDIVEDIEYLSESGAVVRVYEKQGGEWENIDEYEIWYDDLPINIFERIFEIIEKL